MNKIKLIVLLAILTLGCRRNFHKSKPVVEEKPPFRSKELNFEYFQSKAKIDYDDGTNNFSSPMTIRIRRDSVIWISVNPALGIEVVRALITQDSIFVIDKINKDYYALGLNYIKDNFGVDLSFSMIQSALVGNFIESIKKEDSVSIEGDFALVKQKRRSMSFSNYVSKANQKLENVVIVDKTTNNNLTIKYSDFAGLDTTQFAYNAEVVANYLTKKGLMKSHIGIHHQRVDIKDKQMRFPFNVKNKYDKK